MLSPFYRSLFFSVCVAFPGLSAEHSEFISEHIKPTKADAEEFISSVLREHGGAKGLSENMTVFEELIGSGWANATADEQSKLKVKIAAELLKKGADINQKNSYWDTAFGTIMARLESDQESLRLFLFDKGATKQLIRDQEDYREGLIRLAYISRLSKLPPERLKLATHMLQKGVGINEQNSFGQTALMIAAYNLCLPMVDFLLNKGADVNLENKYGYTALDMVDTNRRILNEQEEDTVVDDSSDFKSGKQVVPSTPPRYLEENQLIKRASSYTNTGNACYDAEKIRIKEEALHPTAED